MPIQLNEGNGGKILVVHVSGKLTKADYEHFVPEFERLVQQHGKLRLLFDMTGLQGWDAGALWEDVKFDMKHFADIERLAMVGERKWQQGMASFASRSRRRRSDTSITRTPLRRGSGWAARSPTARKGAIRNECAKAYRHGESAGRRRQRPAGYG